MSYKKKSKTDGLNELFSRLADFNNVSVNLLNANTEEEFEVWFEKLEKIDKRTLYLFLCKNKDKIKEEYLDTVRDRFPFAL